MQAGGWTVDILVQGYPGKTYRHGGLGWSTVLLLRGHDRVAVLDTGNFSARKPILQGLEKHGLGRRDVTDLILSHLHYDHSINWTMFDHARVVTGSEELAWALTEPRGISLIPELYIEALAKYPRLETVGEGAEVLPGIIAYMAPGHTPGHLMFHIDGGAEADLLLVQDAAKYRAELVSGSADMTYDPAVTAATIARIWEFWRRKPRSIVVTGHDLPMILQDGVPQRIGKQEAGIAAIFGEDVKDLTHFPLAQP